MVFGIIRQRIAVAIGQVTVRIILIRRAPRACDGVFVIRIVTVIRGRAVLHTRLHIPKRIIRPRTTVLIAARRHARAEQAIKIVIRVIRRLAARIVLDGEDVAHIVKIVMQIEQCVSAFGRDNVGQAEIVGVVNVIGERAIAKGQRRELTCRIVIRGGNVLSWNFSTQKNVTPFTAFRLQMPIRQLLPFWQMRTFIPTNQRGDDMARSASPPLLVLGKFLPSTRY